ncbi:MAG: MarC family protein [Chloroflexi bacterium]|nr:MarC family protein [Chloroflexota bacterium]
MSDLLQSLVLTFVPLFIVIDALGNLPIMLALSEGITRRERIRLINIATITAVVVGLAFLFLGQLVLDIMGISVGAFAIAGGLVLLIVSIKYILTGQIVEGANREEMMAVVPIGTPLLVGPATVTTLLLLITQHQPPIVLIAFILNMFLAWTIFMAGNAIVHFLGQGGLRAVSSVFSLLLAAIAVSMILRGLSLLDLIDLGF